MKVVPENVPQLIVALDHILERHAATLSDWEFDVLNLTVSFLRIAEAREPTTAALLFQNAVELIRQAEVFAKSQMGKRERVEPLTPEEELADTIKRQKELDV